MKTKRRWKLDRVTASGNYVFVTHDFYYKAPFYVKIPKTAFWAGHAGRYW